MTDAKEFKAMCARRGITLEQVAEKLGITNVSLWRKLRGKLDKDDTYGSEFSQSEMMAIKEILSLDDEQVLSIFFKS